MNEPVAQKVILAAGTPGTEVPVRHCAAVGSPHMAHGMPAPEEVKAHRAEPEPCAIGAADESEGRDRALVVGCDANNANASARTANCNNAVSNSNSNYAFALAVESQNIGKHPASRATSPNIAYGRIATGGCAQPDYSLLPYYDCGGENNVEKAVQPFMAMDNAILDELAAANRKRKLKNLKRFITNPTIVRMGVERCLSRASDSPEVRDAIRNKEEIIARIIRELTDETYRCQKPRPRIIVKKGKGDKDRNADIYTVYDRCVQNVLLIVLTVKLTNKIPRTCYSGIKGRSLWSNDRRYCLVNRIRTFVKTHPDASAGVTDIRHFYESLRSEVVIGVLFESVVCKYTRRLLYDILMQTETLVIGGTLSQLIAMLVLAEMDNELMRRFKPQFYASFGDNRIIMDDDREKVVKAVHWEKSYLEGRYGLTMKGDYQVHRARNGFMFCKQHFRGSFVNVRAELRRRAVRAAIRGQQHYAGYYGMLLKTDSRRLIRMIENNLNKLRMRNQKGMGIRPMQGDLIKINQIEGKEIYIIAYVKRNNNKDSEYFIRFQVVCIDPDGSRHLYVVNNGCFEIKEFFKLVENGTVTLPLKTRVLSEGASYYFEQFHTTNKEACDLICAELGI